MATLARLRDFLDGNHIKYTVLVHSKAYTAQEIAALTHVRGKDLAKTVVVRVDGRFAMVVLPAHHHVVLESLSGLLGGDVTLATENDLQKLFPDSEVGAMPPFGNLYDIPVIVAEPLTRDDEIVFNAGNHTEVVRMSFVDFDRLVKPRLAPCSTLALAPPRVEPV